MNLQVDTADFEKQIGELLRDLQKVTGQTAEEVIIDESKLFALEALNLAPRKGSKAGVLKEHRKDVTKNIQGTFITQLAAAKLVSSKTGYAKGKKGNRLPFYRFKEAMNGGNYSRRAEDFRFNLQPNLKWQTS